MITNIIKEQSKQITPILFSNKIQVSVDSVLDSFLWVYPYLTSDFPEITCDKKYFFLYSPDHDQTLVGGLTMAKGDYLDLRDFEEIGIIRTGHQAETPLLKRFPNEDRPIFLYYHTIDTNPINLCGGNNQETNLMTTTGGDLVNSIWTDETNPLDCQGTVDGVAQNHTGYLNYWNIEGNLIGYHSFGNSGGTSYYQKSTTSNGKNWFHNNPYSKEDVSFGNNRWYQLNRMTPFKRKNGWYAIVQSADIDTNISGGDNAAGQLHIVKLDDRGNITEKLFDLTEANIQPATVYIEGNTAHIYKNTGRPDEPQTFTDFLSYSFLDLQFLDYL